jgi:CTP synthase
LHKHIFITGGVLSSLGKGLTSASIGLLIERRGLRIAMQKIDPYINVDAGTMNPYQHGEVYVTEDGLETDLDLGHYERFTNAKINQHSNYTTGRIYYSTIAKERSGEYLGQTVQVIPHITNEIKYGIHAMAEPEVDVIITEIGGTVGDIEGSPFLEAIRQIGLECQKENVLFIHLTLVPFLKTINEHKTKPTQQSVAKLREIGIQPDAIICRTDVPITQEVRDKIALFCNVSKNAVFEEKDVDLSIYEIPLMLYNQGLDRFVVEKLGLESRWEPDLSDWKELLEIIKNPDDVINIGIVGKYLEVQDAYKSIFEALAHGGFANRVRVNPVKINSEDVEKYGMQKFAKDISGILVPGGFGGRGIEGKILAAKFARENKIPFFGICLGLQIAVIEFARNVLGLEGAHSTEFNKTTSHPVIDLMEQQKTITQKGATMRLGSYECRLLPDSKAYRAYENQVIYERHRHRYEFNNNYREKFEKAGMKAAGINPQQNLVEILEIEDHPWFVGVQFHPEFKSKPIKPHPLFSGFVKACIDYKRRDQ